ncbi:hypothetical protein PATA110616_15330 [Paenibacillus tarimensis]
MLQWYIMMTDGWRGIMVSSDQQLVFGFQNLGNVGEITKRLIVGGKHEKIMGDIYSVKCSIFPYRCLLIV